MSILQYRIADRTCTGKEKVPLDSASGLYEMGNFSMLSDLQTTL